MASLTTVARRITNLIAHGAYIPNDYYVLEERKLVYISIPKVACTSIKTALMGGGADAQSRGAYMRIHSDAERFRQSCLRRSQSAYYKFAFVRNPFDRLVSCYEDKVRTPVQHHGHYFFDTGYNRTVIRTLFGRSFRPDMSFREFLELVNRIPDILADAHFRSQYSMLYKRRRRIPDFVGKFENLNEDWMSLADRFGLPHLTQKNPTRRKDLGCYFSTPELVELAFARYRRDFEHFEYMDNYMELKRCTMTGQKK